LNKNKSYNILRNKDESFFFFLDELILYKPPKQSYNPLVKKNKKKKKKKLEHIQIGTKALKQQTTPTDFINKNFTLENN
jgi:hypothetical protein